MKTEILYRDDGVALGVCGPLVIAVTDGPTAFSPVHIRHAVDHIARLRRTTHTQRLVYVYVAGERCELPGPEARKIAGELGELFDASIGVHEGTGFRASAVRAIVVGISMASRARVRTEVVATLAEAAKLAALRHADLGTEQDVRGALDEVRAAANSAGALGPEDADGSARSARRERPERTSR